MIYTMPDIKNPGKNRGLINVYGGGIEPHRLTSAPLALPANVFTSLTADEFTVNGPKLSTVLFNCFKGLEVFRDLITPRR